MNPNTGQVEGYLPPRDDNNSTDLYIPSKILSSQYLFYFYFL